MTSDLFPDCRQDSPRLAWMKRHGIVAMQDAESLKWGAQIAGPMSMTRFECDYDTIDEALASLGIPLWNEEEYINGKEAQ